MRTKYNENCPTCKRLGRTCAMCQTEQGRAKQLQPHGKVNPLSRVERDQERQANAANT